MNSIIHYVVYLIPILQFASLIALVLFGIKVINDCPRNKSPRQIAEEQELVDKL